MPPALWRLARAFLVPGLAAAAAHAGTLAAQAPAPSIMVRWSNVSFAVRPSPMYGVQVGIRATPAARDLGMPDTLRLLVFPPESIREWLPNARQKGLLDKPGAGTPLRETLSGPLADPENNVVVVGQDPSPPKNQPRHILFTADSTGGHPFMARATTGELRQLLKALDNAASEGAWRPDQQDTTAACVDACTPVVPDPANRVDPPGILLIRRAEAWVCFTVTADGRVEAETIDVIYADRSSLAAVARHSIRGWRFTPAMRNGTPVAQRVSQVIVFVPSSR